MKAIVTAILAIAITFFALATPTDARATEHAEPDIGTATVTELSQVPDGYDAGGCPATYVVSIAE